MARLREKWTALASSLGFRIALSVGLILLGSYVFFVYLVLDIQQDFYFERMIREAERFSAAVINATNHSMLQDDREATRSIIADMGKQEEISDIRIYDHAGAIKFSNQLAEVGTKVDQKAEACFVCHSEDKPFSEVVTDKRTRVLLSRRPSSAGNDNPRIQQAALLQRRMPCTSQGTKGAGGP